MFNIRHSFIILCFIPAVFRGSANAAETVRPKAATVQGDRTQLVAALERFERDYNLSDGTDYSRLTMSAEAWAELIKKVNAATTALDDASPEADYATARDELVAQLEATDASLRLFKSYRAMLTGMQTLSPAEAAAYADGTYMDTDSREQEAIEALNRLFTAYAAAKECDFDASAFLGDNLDFNTPQGNRLTSVDMFRVFDIAGWEEVYENLDQYCFLENSNPDYENQLYIRSNWTSQSVVLKVQKQVMLPVGKYQLSFLWDSRMSNMKNLSQYRLGKKATTLGRLTSGAKQLTYTVTVSDEPTPFDLIFGLQKRNSGDTPAQILVDDITLTYIYENTGDGITDIDGDATDKGKANDTWHDLAGRSIATPQHAGAYLHNGRKVVIR